MPIRESMRSLGAVTWPSLVGLVTMASGCFFARSDTKYCTGEEVDFSVVGSLAGTWCTSGGWNLEFDENDRLRWDEHEADHETFGCEPGEWPLVLDGVTILDEGWDSYAWLKLADYEAESGSIRLLHQDGDKGKHYVHRKIVLVDEHTLDYWKEWTQSTTFDETWEPAFRFYRNSTFPCPSEPARASEQR